MAEAERHDEIQGEIVHVYDDIEEADNQLPLWWLFTFYGAIVFAVFYWFYYHEYDVGLLPVQQYELAVDAARAQRGEVTNAGLVALMQEDAAVAAGKKIFDTQCMACHDQKAQGKEGLGPNLTDRYWVHGGSALDIHRTITNGVAAKGMPPWEPILGAEGVNHSVAYILTLRNTEVPGKAPEGDLYEP